MSRRGTCHADQRGSASDRRARRAWIELKCGPYLRCHHCKRFVGKKFHVDRWPVCGHAGGRYTRDNIVPACAECNLTRCGNQHRPCAAHGPTRVAA